MQLRKNNVALILATSHLNGNTIQLCEKIISTTKVDCFNLSQYEISYFDYNNQNKNDDFLPLMRRLIDNYDTFIFASPIYWYAMCAQMKTFFDRTTDLLTVEKELGRKLRGKKAMFITSSIGNHLGDNFWLPIKATFDYLGMKLIFTLHCKEKEISNEQIKGITKKIEEF